MIQKVKNGLAGTLWQQWSFCVLFSLMLLSAYSLFYWHRSQQLTEQMSHYQKRNKQIANQQQQAISLMQSQLPFSPHNDNVISAHPIFYKKNKEKEINSSPVINQINKIVKEAGITLTKWQLQHTIHSKNYQLTLTGHYFQLIYFIQQLHQHAFFTIHTLHIKTTATELTLLITLSETTS